MMKRTLQVFLCLGIVWLAYAFWMPRESYAQDDRGRALSKTSATRSSPFDPPSEDVFVADDGPGLDTGCTFNDDPGHPLMIDIVVDQFVGAVDGNGFLVNPAPLIAAGIIPASIDVIMPAFDIDVNGTPPPEHDEVIFNGQNLGLLNGDNNIWLLNSFSVPISQVKFPAATGGTATNRVQINIDLLSTGRWCMAIDWVALLIPIRPKIALTLTVMGGNKVREIADDIIYKQSFDASCTVTTDIGPVDDFPFSGSSNKEVTLHTKIEFCPETGEDPEVKAMWSVNGPVPLRTSGTSTWTGFEGDVKLKMLDRVTVGSADVDYEIDSQTASVSRKVFVTKNDPLASVRPVKKSWYEKAVPWGKGAGPGEANEATILENLLAGEYAFGNANWRYGYRFGGPIKCNWQNLVDDPITCNYTDCYVFSDVFENMAAVLGIGGLAAIRVLGANSIGFVTNGAPSIDPAFPGSTRPFAGGAFDRYLFSSHSLRLKGKYHDATFNGLYTSRTQFISWNLNGRATDADGVHSTTDEGAKIYPLAGSVYDSWGSSRYKTPPSAQFTVGEATMPIDLRTGLAAPGIMTVQSLTFTGNNTFTEVDDNADGFFEALRVNVEVQTTTPGAHSVFGILRKGGVDIANQPAFESMLFTSATFDEAAGTYTVDLDFSGEQIFRSGEDGPYDLFVFSVDPNSDSADDTFTTPAVVHTDYGEVAAVLTSATDTAVDTDTDGDFDFVRVSVEVTVRAAGDFSLQGDLSGGGVSLVGANGAASLTPGTHTVDLEFAGAALRRSGEDGPYDGTVNLLDDTGHTLQSLSFTTQAYTSGTFGALLNLDGSFNDQGVDTNSNGLFDILRVSFGADVQAAGTYLVSGQLTGPGGDFVAFTDLEQTLAAGSQTIMLDFLGPVIRQQALDGPFDVEVVLRDPTSFDELDRVPLGSQTAAYNATDFDPFAVPDILLTGTTNDFGVDTNANGLFDELHVEVDVALTTAGFYQWSARLVDADGTEIDFDARSGSRSAGPSTIDFIFEGVKVGDNGADGPYFVKGLLMFTNAGANTVITDVAETQPYSVTEFESTNRPPVADAGVDQTVDYTGPGTTVLLDGSGSSDPDGDALTYTWREDGSVIAGPTTEALVAVDLSLGVHTIELTVDDGKGRTDTDDVVVTIRSPQEALDAIRADLQVLLDGATCGSDADKDLDKAVDRLTKALDEDNWTDAVTPDAKKGKKIFDESKQAVKELEDIAEDAGPCAGEAQAALDALVGIMERLAQAAIDEAQAACDAQTDTKEQEKCQKEVDKANEEMAKATDDLADGKPDKAIDKYKKAWDHALKALGKIDDESEPGKGALAAEVPDAFALEGNYPNPFNPETKIRFSVPETAEVRLTVYDVLGRQVRVLVDGSMPAGRHEVRFEASGLPSGAYFYRLETPQGSSIQQMLLVK